MILTASSDKQTVREETQKKVFSLSKVYRQEADIKINTTLTKLSQYAHSQIICTYVSTEYEVDTIELITSELLLQRKRIIVPEIHSQTIQLYEITSMSDLCVGKFGIQEPIDTCTRINPRDVDLFLVPGIAFGKDKTRIGRGKGYYDQLLQGVSGTTIGLCYNAQIYTSVVHDAKDVQLDIIVTETEIFV